MLIAILGGGVLGEAIARGLISSGYEVIVTEKRDERIRELEKLGFIVMKNNKAAVKQAEIVILCVKPKDIEDLLNEISEEIKGKILISVAAAIPISFLKKVAQGAKIFRAMPNLAVLVREAFIAYSADQNISQGDIEVVTKVLGALGKVYMVEETHMDAITALNGCAPAYMSLVAEAMMYAGLEIGLERDLTLAIVAQAMIGTGKLILDGKKTPSEICAMVTTPGGVTVEGLFELESFPVRHAFMRAIKAAAEKTRKTSLSFGYQTDS
ncbi:MAG: pyrroline-5-carboxylate reductase [Candidatus Bathyarchaeia archaeon]